MKRKLGCKIKPRISKAAKIAMNSDFLRLRPFCQCKKNVGFGNAAFQMLILAKNW